MTDENKATDTVPANDDNVEQQQAANEAGAEEQPLDELALYKSELAELKDRFTRAIAETENIRRRAERDRNEAASYAATAFARDMLEIADNLRRALEAVPDTLRDDATAMALVSGVEATERQLLAAFEKHGVSRVNPEGQKFDPNFHQAMFEVETTEAAPGTVMQVMQPGYRIKDRLLRPAMVGVAKAPVNLGQKPKGIDETV